MIRLYFVLTWRRCSSFIEAHYHDALMNLCHLSCATIAIYNTQWLIFIYVILMQSHSTFLSPRLAGQLNRMRSLGPLPVSWTSRWLRRVAQSRKALLLIVFLMSCHDIMRAPCVVTSSTWAWGHTVQLRDIINVVFQVSCSNTYTTYDAQLACLR